SGQGFGCTCEIQSFRVAIPRATNCALALRGSQFNLYFGFSRLRIEGHDLLGGTLKTANQTCQPPQNRVQHRRFTLSVRTGEYDDIRIEVDCDRCRKRPETSSPKP